jgi:hypothetical protein
MQYPKLDYKKGGAKKDACYHKVKSRYSVWPSAYASGALAKCRKVGASNWGSKKQMGGVDVDFRTADERKADSKAQRKQDRKDKKGMIPARFRNRGQEGLDAYKKMMAKKRKKKKNNPFAKFKKARKTRKAARQGDRNRKASSGSGCQGKGCGAYERYGGLKGVRG